MPEESERLSRPPTPSSAAAAAGNRRLKHTAGTKVIDRIHAIAAYNEQLAAQQLHSQTPSPVSAAASSSAAAAPAALSSPLPPWSAAPVGEECKHDAQESADDQDLASALQGHPSHLVPGSSGKSSGGRSCQRTGRRYFYSFEFFPPKTVAGVVNLYNRIDFMAAMEPLFVDITWGTGGGRSSSGLLTLEIAKTVQQFSAAEVMMHLTCTNLSVTQILEILELTKQAGIRNILALRGDPPRGAETWEPCDNGLCHAVDLVRLIRQHYGDHFCIGVAGYPEGHVASKDLDLDVKHLAEKVAAGADFVLTQQFHSVDRYFTWLDKCEAAGITCPIIPGIMAIQNYNSFKRMTAFCKTYVPDEIHDQLEPIKHDDARVKAYGIQLAAEMCRTLLDSGRVPGLHFYTLNLQRSVCAILEKLGFIGQPEGSLPWKQSQVSRRQNEDVRPIFWSNRPQSYLSRTHTWDEFPNGRWGDNRSPAFGDLSDYHGLSLRTGRPSDRAGLWGKTLPQGVRSVNEVFANFLLGKVPRLPWCETAPQAETHLIQDSLVRMNRYGFLSINSQPRVNGAPSSDPAVGWGGPDGYVYQKAYLEFFTSPENLHRLMDLLPKHPSLGLNALNSQGHRVTNLSGSGHSVTAVTWGVFPDKEIIQPTVVDSESFQVWKDEAFLLWRVQWQSIFPCNSESWSAIQHIHDAYYLVSLVDNNFVSGNIFAIFEELLQSEPLAEPEQSVQPAQVAEPKEEQP